MKRIVSILSLSVLALMMAGAVTVEDKFTISIFNWFGLDSDEPFSPDMMKPNDTWNVEIGMEGGRTYIQQRRGTRRIIGGAPGPATNIRSFTISQIDGDTERVVAFASDGKVYQTVGNGTVALPAWFSMTSAAIANNIREFYMPFVLFKDTLLVVGDTNIFLFARTGAPNSLNQVAKRGPWEYRGILLHQDRIYGFGIEDSNNTILFWMPEFSLFFQSDSVNAAIADERAGFAYVDRDAGDFITNVVPMGEHLMVYKSRSVYKALISPTANVPVEIIRFAEGVGAYGFGAVTRFNHMHYFVGEDGVYENNGASIRKISGAIDYWFQDSLVHSTGAAKVFRLEAFDNKLFVSLPKKDASAPGDVGGYRFFVYNFDSQVWSKWRFSNHEDFNGEEHFLLRYEYTPTAAAPLGIGGIFLKQRLIIVIDSSASVGKDVFWEYPDVDYLSDGGATFEAMYKTGLSPLTTMANRKRFERILLYGQARVGVSDSALNTWVVYANQNGDQDSTYFSFGTSGAANVTRLFNYRINPKVEGELMSLRIMMRDTNWVKISALEIIGSEPGLADEN